MPIIRPFKAILYDTQKISLVNVVAPPYDVISTEQQEELYKRHPQNIIRLELSREKNPYDSAAQQFAQWKKDAMMISDASPAIYILSQSFNLPDGKHYERTGFVAACRLEEFGKGLIYPHEKTHSGPKEDRLKLFHATGAIFSQIFSLYSDEQSVLDAHIRTAMNAQPDLDVEFERVRNRVWKITDGKIISAFADAVKTKKVYIADGHHRYETALAYRDEMKQKNPNHTGDEPYNFVQMCFVNIHQPGLIVLPTHRVVHGLPDFNTNEFLETLKEHFHLDLCATPEELLNDLANRGARAYGLVLPEFPYYVLFWLREAKMLNSLGIPFGVAKLDVTVLHQFVLKDILNISEESQEKKLNLEYVKDSQQVFQLVKERKMQFGFILNPTPVEQVQAVAELNLVMPQKSTYFYPKLLSGLITYSFVDA